MKGLTTAFVLLMKGLVYLVLISSHNQESYSESRLPKKKLLGHLNQIQRLMTSFRINKKFISNSNIFKILKQFLLSLISIFLFNYLKLHLISFTLLLFILVQNPIISSFTYPVISFSVIYQ